MDFLFKVLFCFIIIIASGAFYLHTPVGARIISKIFRYSGMERTEQRVAENRSNSKVVREKNLMMKEAVDRRLELLRDRSLRQGATSPAEDAAELARKARELHDKVRNRIDAEKDNEAFVDAQRERAMAQKERMDAKAARR